ncbi:SMP-30/gluconolactonase/LRE family protein [Symbioplanes lichenis]|uniref:SMP-30/gluconolactonase/LRE family protein n=1 Tax=Symbioplanes lichenis TaxID=1629072 RepID=UPI00273906FA|nr:SMP-30/gluconolactonase/LRE family protein [Actinoplanes lichenis]
MADVDVLSGDRFELGEGGRWVGDQVLLVNIPAGRLYRTPVDDMTQLTEIAHLDVPLAAIAPVADRPGVYLAAAGTGFTLIGAETETGAKTETGAETDTSAETKLGQPEPVTDREWRMNDAIADRAGRLWAGSMACDQTKGCGALYRLDPDGSVRTVLRSLTIANGPAFSPDGRVMYLSDTPLGHIDAFDVSPAGELSNRRPFARLDPEQGAPDGLTVDSDGYVWAALFGGGAVQRFRPDGEPDRRVPVPARQPTSVCLAGDTLVVTSGRGGLDDPADADGAVMITPAGATGIPALPVRLNALAAEEERRVAKGTKTP